MCYRERGVAPDHIAAGEPDRRGASVARCRQCIEQRRDEGDETSLYRTFEEYQLGIAEKGANAYCSCQIARDEFEGADKRKTRQAKGAGESDGALTKTARIVPSVMELRQQDVGCDVDRADPASRPEHPADTASQGGSVVPRHCRPVAAQEAHP